VVITPDPHSGRCDPLTPTPSSAFGRARGASAPVLGPKPWSPLTFQLWLLAPLMHFHSFHSHNTAICNQWCVMCVDCRIKVLIHSMTSHLMNNCTSIPQLSSLHLRTCIYIIRIFTAGDALYKNFG